jgi:hypothetical protein
MRRPRPDLGCSVTEKKAANLDVVAIKEHPTCFVVVSQAFSYTDLRYPDLGHQTFTENW